MGKIIPSSAQEADFKLVPAAAEAGWLQEGPSPARGNAGDGGCVCQAPQAEEGIKYLPYLKCHAGLLWDRVIGEEEADLLLCL